MINTINMFLNHMLHQAEIGTLNGATGGELAQQYLDDFGFKESKTNVMITNWFNTSKIKISAVVGEETLKAATEHVLLHKNEHYEEDMVRVLYEWLVWVESRCPLHPVFRRDLGLHETVRRHINMQSYGRTKLQRLGAINAVLGMMKKEYATFGQAPIMPFYKDPSRSYADDIKNSTMHTNLERIVWVGNVLNAYSEHADKVFLESA